MTSSQRKFTPISPGYYQGGNDYCLQKGDNGLCAENLHEKWDASFGAFQSTANRDVKNESKRLQTLYLENNLKQQANDLSVDSWINNNLSKERARNNFNI